MKDAINACSDAWTPKPQSPRSMQRVERYEKEEFDVDQELTLLIKKNDAALKRDTASVEDALANDEDMKEILLDIVKMQWTMRKKTEEVKREDREGTPPRKDWCTTF